MGGKKLLYGEEINISFANSKQYMFGNKITHHYLKTELIFFLSLKKSI